MPKMTDDDRAMRDVIAGACMAAMNAHGVYNEGQRTPAQRANLAFIDADAFMAERAKRLAAESAAPSGGRMTGPNEAGFPTPWRVDTDRLTEIVVDSSGDVVMRLNASRPGMRNLLEWVVAMVNSCAD